MGECFAEYLIPIKNFKLSKNYNIPHPSCNIENIEIEQFNNQDILARIFFKEETISYIKRNEVETILNNIRNKIAFYYEDSAVGNFFYHNDNLDGKKSYLILNSNVGIINSEKEKILEKELLKKQILTNELYEKFTLATQNTDIVSKFMFLYQILLDETRYGKQKEVDKIIKRMKNKKDVIKTDIDYRVHQKDIKTRHGQHINETKFTFLRNQVGHSIKECTPETTRRDMELCIGDLQRIVKQVIKEKTGNF